jgi:endonuclease-3
MKTSPDWDTIVGNMIAWRAELEAEESATEAAFLETAQEEKEKKKLKNVPSVSTVAERYKRDPWAVLVSTILSLRTKDEVTLVTSKALLDKAPSPEALLTLPEEEVARLAYPAGFYRTKAANLMKIAAILTSQYGGSVPADLDALLALPGVGRKTANLVLIEAFDMDGICVDVHVHRISNRMGLVSTKSPDETEEALRRGLPLKYWKPINALLVLYGQRICRPMSPFCSQCVIKAHCRRIGVERFR